MTKQTIANIKKANILTISFLRIYTFQGAQVNVT